MEKKMTIIWDDENNVRFETPKEALPTKELIGVLELCKLIVFEGRQQQHTPKEEEESK